MNVSVDCPFCSTTVPDSRQFCPQCGATNMMRFVHQWRLSCQALAEVADRANARMLAFTHAMGAHE